MTNSQVASGRREIWMKCLMSAISFGMMGNSARLVLRLKSRRRWLRLNLTCLCETLSETAIAESLAEGVALPPLTRTTYANPHLGNRKGALY